MNFELYVDNELHYISTVVITYITKKEPKPDDRLSKFDWRDLSPIFFDHNASSLSKSILETNKTSFASYSLIQ